MESPQSIFIHDIDNELQLSESDGYKFLLFDAAAELRNVVLAMAGARIPLLHTLRMPIGYMGHASCDG